MCDSRQPQEGADSADWDGQDRESYSDTQDRESYVVDADWQAWNGKEAG